MGKYDTPAADWACKEALVRIGLASRYDTYDWDRSSVAFKELARMIEQHEEPPVDPDLLLAREIYAEQLAKGGYGLSFINDAKTGKLDRYSGLVSTLTGIKEGRKLGSE